MSAAPQKTKKITKPSK